MYKLNFLNQTFYTNSNTLEEQFNTIFSVANLLDFKKEMVSSGSSVYAERFSNQNLAFIITILYKIKTVNFGLSEEKHVKEIIVAVYKNIDRNNTKEIHWKIYKPEENFSDVIINLIANH